MKSIGIVRKIDELGRIVLPIELRNKMDMNTKDSVEIFVDNDKIILKKYQPCCVFCGNADNVTMFKGKLVCRDCIEEMTRESAND
ncbi:MAG: AbrB/MazE/SpoVT family DNA-binding domain-containing protein [Eubacteriales bacterium]|nr:AbrB/MazE/SpoVT family DNA-binding domain-containing protein [Clostridiales bacterium]MDD7300376.1 AbrB/MazE/SpoVT family DNA-binding domain-containing protein [Eubacteriales bacterium]MDY4434846.1 AbrB/MazE/SpoVT family DNA-binding domain-containing protein [Candidatus Flemingibacterium sp.]